MSLPILLGVIATATASAWAYRRRGRNVPPVRPAAAPEAPPVPVAAQPDRLTKYPFIFNIDNISDLFPPVGGQGPVSGWSVTFRDDMRPTLLPGARQRGAAVLKGHIVAIMGLRNVGKTWFVNKMCDTALPSGTVEATPGIGFVLPLRPSMKKQVPLIFMDSPGTNAPVRTISQNLEESQREISNRMISNHVISEIMMRNAEHVVVVVQHISHQDQLLIQRLLQYREVSDGGNQQGGSASQDLAGNLIVLHNLLNSKTAEEGRAQFRKVAELYSDVETLFAEEDDRYFHFNTQRHIYLINDETPEGAAFNEAQLSQIQQWLTATPGQSTFANMVHNVCQVINEVLPSYIVPGPEDSALITPVVYPAGLAYRRPPATGAEPAEVVTQQPDDAQLDAQPLEAQPGFFQLRLTLRGMNSESWDEVPNANLQMIQLGNEFTRFDSLRPYFVQRNQFTPPHDVLIVDTGVQVRIEIAGCDIQRLPQLERNAPMQSEGWRVIWGSYSHELIVRGVRAEPGEYARYRPALAPGFGKVDKIRYKNWEVRCKLPANVEKLSINKEQSVSGMLVFDFPFRQW
eukprot:TRINITY_DN411_c0_g1_i4.p1 TRINITY_DN411_c0_g1~~TRINITY_DN411_c0_g1_i4.p1  ORF type:complete len:581 (-),score=139.45 TRINITY_DN411_c0_g1_i4:41-1756(-)